MTTVCIDLLARRGLLRAAVPLLLLTVARASGGTIFVDDDAPGDPGPGDLYVSDPDEDGSANHPYDGIQEAIDAAADGDEVVVADGTYSGAWNRDLDFHGKAITVRSENGPANCIIDCQSPYSNYHRGFHFHTGETEASVVEGLTITNGWIIGDGGGILCDESSPTIRDCVFADNSAFDGAGIYCCLGAPRVEDCTFRRNVAQRGGGIACDSSAPTIVDCTFIDNDVYSTGKGAAVFCTASEPTIARCTMVHNVADHRGGGVHFEANSGGTVTACAFTGNQATYGGGIACEDSAPLIADCIFVSNEVTPGDYGGWGAAISCDGSAATIRNCAMMYNVAHTGGGGVSFGHDSGGTVTNCTIIQNTGDGGGGISCRSNSFPAISNCTIAYNVAQTGGGIEAFEGSIATLVNCVVWGNAPDHVYVWAGAEAVITFSDVQGGWPGEGNLNIDPLLTQDFTHLSADSPCRDAGDPEGDYAEQVDFDGEPRVAGTNVDMGSDEFVDSDVDGLPDFWEVLHFGSPTAADPAGDPDDDTASNLEEYEASRNPRRGPAVFHVDVTGDDAWDGLAPIWDGEHGPKATIQVAIDATERFEGDEVLVADGIYSGTGNRDIRFFGNEVLLHSTGGRDGCVIDCGGAGRAFTFDHGETAQAIVDGFTLTGGEAERGGAVFCRASSPQLRNCTFVRNHAADGGGVHCRYGQPVIDNCAFRDNTATGYGGGFHCVAADASIVRCVFVGNGGSHGGGMTCLSSDTTVANCLFAQNWGKYDGGAAHCRGMGNPAMVNCTVVSNAARNGGGVYCRSGAALSLTSCVMVGNRAYQGANVYSQSPLVVSYSAVSGGEESVYLGYGGELEWGAGNLAADPLLTPDWHLRADSPCRDAGDPEGAYSDRSDMDGEPRLVGDGVDMGADEFLDSDDDGLPDWWETAEFGAPTSADALADEEPDGRTNIEEYAGGTNPWQGPRVYYVDTSGDDGWDGLTPNWDGEHGPKATIQAAIDAAHPREGDEVRVAAGTYAGSGNRDLDFGGRAIPVVGVAGAEACVIDCEVAGRGFHFHSRETGASIVDGFTVTNGYADEGGAIYCWLSSPTIMNCEFEENTADSSGAGLHCSRFSDPSVVACEFTANAAGSGGGAVYTTGGTPTVTDCVFNSNTASSGAGAHSYKSDLKMAHCTVTGNTAAYSGGGVTCIGGSALLQSCAINRNVAAAGGGVYCSGGSISIRDCLIADNDASETNGGGVFVNRGKPTIDDCVIARNCASGDGGGVSVRDTNARIRGCTLRENSARDGAGVYCDERGDATISDALITLNAATRAGGGVCCWFSDPTVTKCVITENSALDGGGVYHFNSEATILNCTVSRNSGVQSAGGIYCRRGSPRVINTVVSENVAFGAAGVYCERGTPVIVNCTLVNNKGDNFGGGVYASGESSHPTVTNCVVWRNAATSLDADFGASLTVTYSDIEGGWLGEGNIDSEPRFVDVDHDDYHLAADSPCIDVGDPAFLPGPGETDVDGRMRVWDGDGDGISTVDMGAHEFGSFRFGDLDCDGTINTYDTDAFAVALGGTYEHPPFTDYDALHPGCDAMLADCNGDGLLNGFDIDAFVARLSEGR